VEVVLEALGGGEPGHPLVHPAGVVDRHPVLPRQVLERRPAADGRVRVELEALPFDLDLAGPVEAGERRLEAALADVAPGTDHVRPDLDFHSPSVPTKMHSWPREPT